MTHKAVVIFSGYNNRAVLAFVRTLVMLGVEYYIVARDRNDPIFKTTYKTKVVAVREKKLLDEVEIEEILKFIIDLSGKGILIAPSTEALNRFVLDRIDLFREIGCVVPLVDKEIYKTISDKKPFSELCRKYDIKIPSEYEHPGSASLPFVAKPKIYGDTLSGVLNPIIIYTDQNRQRFIDEERVNDYYYQEFIEGGSYYLLYYISIDGCVYKLSQENLIQQPEGKSIIAAVGSNVHNHKISDKFELMLLKEHFHGLIMIELRGRGDELCMIEANPRFWGPSQFFVDNGYNLFIPFLIDYEVADKGAMNLFESNFKKNRYFWKNGIAKIEDLDFHNYSSVNFGLEYEIWSSCDIYERPDVLTCSKVGL